jgi:hypothetical protein
MAAIFWLAIAFSGVVGFIAFLASEFATDKLMSFLERWKLLQNERTKRNELRLFALISRLHAGKRDRYIFFAVRSQIAVAVAIFGAIIAVIPFNVGLAGPSVLMALMEVAISFVMLVLFLTTSVRLFQKLTFIKSKLFNYEGYRKQVTKRWGKTEASKVNAEL